MISYFKNQIIKFVKHRCELEYWKKIKKAEHVLSNKHYEYFYTTLFNIEKSFYNGKKLLDIGCGPRGSLVWADNALERVGLDPLVKEYKKIGIDYHDMKYVNSGSENIPFLDEYFDAVFSFNSLDHVDNLNMSIDEIKRILKSGGFFLLITEVNHKPTICEPQVFTSEITDLFVDDFLVADKKLFVKNKGIYQSIMEKKEYDRELNGAGVLVAKFIKK